MLGNLEFGGTTVPPTGAPFEQDCGLADEREE
jgi:hypothetical protein